MPAYMTVEASLVMPLVLAVIVLLLYAAFCTYNRCIGSQDAYILCMREAQHKDSRNTRSAERVESMQASQFAQKYISVSHVGGSASVEGNTVAYAGQAVVGTDVSLVHLLLSQDRWGMHFSGSSEVRDPAYHVRKLRRTAAVVRQLAQGAEAGGQESP